MEPEENFAVLESGLESPRSDVGRRLDDGLAISGRLSVSRTRSSVCRTSFLACALIICVHLVLVYTIDMGPAIDRLARQQATILIPGSAAGSQEARSRSKRDLTENEKEHLETDSQTLSSAKDMELSHVTQGDEGEMGEGTRPKNPSSSSPICRSGHIQGFNGVCEAQPCLRRLQGHPSSNQLSSDASDLTSSQVLRRISRMSGRLDTVHFSLVPFIARFQWANGIYGSVGEFGVAMGKFTSLLSTYTDVEVGERLFVCDCFNRSTTSSSSTSSAGGDRSVAGLSPFKIFSTHMKEFGFEETEVGPRKLHLFRGSSWTLDKSIFSSWDLPQFRLISIDADLDRLSLLSDLEMATCLLRDGGVIVVNGVDDSESKQLTSSTLISFFRNHGQSALTPIISAGNKLYLTTTNWRRKYIQALTSDVILTHSGLIQSAVMEPFSSEHLTLTATL